MTSSASSSPRVSPRFRGPAASSRSQNLTAGAIVAMIAGIGIVGALVPAGSLLGVLMFFAVGAGAGYSLSGSV